MGRIVFWCCGFGREFFGESFGFSFCLVVFWNGVKMVGEGVVVGVFLCMLVYFLIFFCGIFWCSGVYYDFWCVFFVNLFEFEEILLRLFLRICFGGNLGKENGFSE